VRCYKLEVKVVHPTRRKMFFPADLLHDTEETNTHLFNSPFSGTTQVSRYQRGKTNQSGFYWRRDSEWQWHQLLSTHYNSFLYASLICKSAPRSRQITMPAPHKSICLQAGCPSCRPTNSIKALKAQLKKLRAEIGGKLVRNTYARMHAQTYRTTTTTTSV